MTTNKIPQLTLAAFEALVASAREKQAYARGRRFTDEGIELARLVLVDGKGYAEASAVMGFTDRGRAYQATQRLLKYAERSVESRTYTGPAEMFAEIDQVAQRYGGTWK
ncbi:hypothetical protein WK78_03180 [Burkholderia cepacia]|uniref:hypothetical protein n=1 Tax=Burkholderia cepacia TaxID=292 RepID=UPI0007555BFC|nr:hypothetical protein [Burkholderia cepacia]KVV25106.1 hypothetical protein WK78_03180 [Burkholderia cepacia]